MLDIRVMILGAVSTNCYIISNRETREAIIIDPADKVEEINKRVIQEELKVVGVLLTHGHFDHILAADNTRQMYKVNIYASKEEAPLLADSNKNCACHMGILLQLEADRLLEDKEIFELGGMNIQVLHTPGHTAGSCCYYFTENGLLVSGDTLFKGSVGRTDLPTGNTKQLLQSIQTKLLCLPEETKVLPGHGDATTIGYEKEYNVYLNHSRN